MRKFTWGDLYHLGKYSTGKKWYPIKEIERYFAYIRPPSHAFPWSYAKAALTYKFYNWLQENEPDVFVRIANKTSMEETP
jgi:hypothetical protein